MKSILRYIAVLLVSIASNSYTMSPDKPGFNAGMGIGLSGPRIPVPRLGTQPEEQQTEQATISTQVEHEVSQPLLEQLTLQEQAKVKLAANTIEDAFKKADIQGRAAAHNLLRLPFEIQVRILDSLTPQERFDIAEMSKSHQELIKKYNEQRIKHLAQMQTELRYLRLLTVDNIIKLGKAFPNIKKLVVRDIRVVMDKLLLKAITVAFPQLELIEIIDCDPLIFFSAKRLIFDKWEKDKPSLTINCRPSPLKWPRGIFIYRDPR